MAQVVAGAMKGLSDQEIATELGISFDTVGTYWRRIRTHYGCSSRAQCVAVALISAFDETGVDSASDAQYLIEIARRLTGR